VILPVVVVLVLMSGAAGCAALPVSMLGAAALSGGANSVARAGTEYTMGGVARRTVSMPADAVHDTALETLARLGIKMTEEERERDGRAILRGKAYERGIEVTIEPVTPAMTRFGVAVRHGISRDGPTAAEVLAQIQRAIEHRSPGAASP
jgi:hypothetical protein